MDGRMELGGGADVLCHGQDLRMPGHMFSRMPGHMAMPSHMSNRMSGRRSQGTATSLSQSSAPVRFSSSSRSATVYSGCHDLFWEFIIVHSVMLYSMRD